MTQAERRAGFYPDFRELYWNGSGDEVLERCTAITSLGPVKLARRHGVRAARAARTLLTMAAEAATTDDQKYVRAGAAATGIKPKSVLGSAKNSAGPKTRNENAGKEDGCVGRRAASDKRESKYYPAYADAIIELVEDIEKEPAKLSEYLQRCGWKDDTVTSEAGELRTPEPAAGSDYDRPPQGVTVQEQARPVILTAIRSTLDTQQASCAARSEPFLTPHLLLALLELKDGRVEYCFDALVPGLAEQIRQELHQYVNVTLRQEPPSEGIELEWQERPDVQRARKIAAQMGEKFVNDAHILLGVLETDSKTCGQLADLLGAEKFRRLGEHARQACRGRFTPSTPGSVFGQKQRPR